MTMLVPALQALVRNELTARRSIELGTVTEAFTNEGGSGDTNLAVNLRLRGSALELQRVPVAVGRLGVSLAPRVGDVCVVAFVDGDLNGPVVIGFLYDADTRPPDAKKTEIVYLVPDDEQEGDRRVEIQLPTGNKVTVEDKKVTIAMGGTTMTVEADGDITLEAGGNLELKAQGDVNVKAQGSINVEATNAASIKGVNVTVEGQAAATLKGATTSIAGMTSFSAG
jgi:uncharacterized protein involved in type VI secretion and phage assembly